MNILLLGTHGQFNWGDEILLESGLMVLGKENQYQINSYDPKDTFKKHHKNFSIKTFHTTKDLIKLPFKIFKSDALFYAGGSILKELYKSYGRSKYSTLIMILLLTFFARRIAFKKVIMSNIGVGPVDTKIGFWLVKLILSQVNFASFRDQESFENVKIAFNGKVPERFQIVPDAVFSRTAQSFGITKLSKSLTTKTLKIALNLNFDIANPSNWEYFVDSLAADLISLSKKQDIEIHALPMQTAFNPHNDVVILNQFKSKIPGIKFVPHIPKSSTELAQLIDHADLVIAERLHTLIICTILNKPFVALSYDVKVDSLLKLLDMQNFSVNINEKFAKNTVLKRVEFVLRNYAEVKIKLNQNYQKLHIQSQDYFTYIKDKLK